MDEATRRSLLFGKPLSEGAKPITHRQSAPSGGIVGGLEGLRQLQEAGVELPEGMQYEELEEEWAIEPTVRAEEKAASPTSVGAWLAALGIFLLAALPRLYVVFFLTDPQNPGLGWYGDTFHHWQIAYLSKEVGFTHGFLRLWDFKGVEYFWGLLHPLVLAGLFAITGSVDILIPRMLSLITGSVSVVILFLIAKRHFNPHVAAAAAILAALNPVGVFSDSSGMQEPLGIMLLLAGIYFWPRHSLATGVLWGAAGMVRAEYWVFGAGLVLAAVLLERAGTKAWGVTVGWATLTLLYMKYLLDKTGNPLYPVYWSYLGNAAGEWMADIPLDSGKTAALWGFRLVFVLMLAAAAHIALKQPKYQLIYLLGIGNLLFLSGLLGFSAYVRGYLPRFLVDRIFELPYMILGLIVASWLFRGWPYGKLAGLQLAARWVILGGLLCGSQLSWIVITRYLQPGLGMWNMERQLAARVSFWHTQGTISIPEDRPWLTYFLVRDHGISGKQIEGQMYDPFAYIEGDPFGDWPQNRLIVQDWLYSRDIKLLVFYSDKQHYNEMIRREPTWFNLRENTMTGGIEIYDVTVTLDT